MTLFALKIAEALVSPAGVVMLLMTIALCVPRRAFLSRLALLAGLISIWVSAMPVMANWLYLNLEAEYPPIAIEQTPTAEVAIVLGGVISPPLPPRVSPDLGDAVDRIVEAARLFRAGKVSRILTSGGELPWAATSVPEAELMKAQLVELGVPAEAILTESESANTHENAVNSARLLNALGVKTALLVTSAAHMPRALAAFRAAHVDVIAASTDVRAVYPLWSSALDFLPDADALAKTSEAIRERLSLLAYRLFGWA